MASVQSWVWGILAAALCLIILIVLIIIKIISKRKKRLTSNDDVEKNNEQIPSQSSTAIADESIIVTENNNNNSNNNKNTALYGQQFAVVDTLHTVLSPPPRERKESNTSISLVHPELTPQKAREVFSLSPHQEVESIATPTSFSSSRRTITPFQGNTAPINPGWRGPTPPWTHSSSPRQSFNNK